MSRRLVVEADGGSRGNPGPAGYGALVCDADTGDVLAEVAEPIGTASNNVAEYRGLAAGLAAAARIDPAAAVEARMDSKLVVEQMSGRWKIKHPDMRAMAEEARAAAAGFTRIRYTWVPRADNGRADALANEAMDAAAEGRAVRLGAERVSGPVTEPPAPAAPGTGWVPEGGAATRLILLRHGETPLSSEWRFAGTGDIELTATGHAQAEAAAARMAAMGIDTIVSSPLRRARETAARVAEALGIAPVFDDRLREADFGSWEGLTLAEAQERDPAEARRWLGDPTAAPPGGESFAAVAERTAAAREAVLAGPPGRTVLLVGHVSPIKVLLQQALGAPLTALYRMHLDVGCVNEVDCYSGGHMVVRSLNDTGHLRSRP